MSMVRSGSVSCCSRIHFSYSSGLYTTTSIPSRSPTFTLMIFWSLLILGSSFSSPALAGKDTEDRLARCQVRSEHFQFNVPRADESNDRFNLVPLTRPVEV